MWLPAAALAAACVSNEQGFCFLFPAYGIFLPSEGMASKQKELLRLMLMSFGRRISVSEAWKITSGPWFLHLQEPLFLHLQRGTQSG